MPLTNAEIAQIFANIADLLEIKGESRFRFLSYRRASETLRDLPRDLQAYADEGTLGDIPGVGDAITQKIQELLGTGRLAYYERLRAEIPEALLQIKAINGVGPKKAKLFYEALGIDSVAALEAAARAGKLRDLSGMGAKSEQKILEGIEGLKRRTSRTPLGVAKPAADAILAELLTLPQAEVGVVAGSIRRGRATIGDVDMLIASDDAAPIMAAVVNMPRVARVLGHGATKSSVELANGLQVDVRVLPRAQWGTALQYFTGSQAHNIKMRQIALQRGYSLNEWALSPVDEAGNIIPDAQKVQFGTEEAVYEFLGLQWVPPELREDLGEIDLARRGALPTLIRAEDIVSDLHMHTTASDGRLSIREMAEAARARGRRFIVITDHSQRSAQAGGLSVARLMQQQEDLRRIDAEMGGDFHVLHGCEVDILEDGRLDFSDEVLAQLDVVVASPHYGLQQDRATFTQRLLNAIRNPHVDIIGHPSGRLIGRRDAAAVDYEAIINAAAETGTALEINANPSRLDLDAQYVRLAMARGAHVSINTDAHRAEDMDMIAYGILTARRGWVTPERCINTWPYEPFMGWVRQRGQTGNG